MAHQKNPLHPQSPLMESDIMNKINHSSSLSPSSSSPTNQQSQEYTRLPVEASDLDKKRRVELGRSLPSEASGSDKRKQSVPSTEKQQREQEHHDIQEQEHQEHQETEEHGGDDNGRERLKRHGREVAGRVWIPEIWGQEELLKDWIDSSTFDSCLVPTGISSARAALVEEARQASSNGGLRLHNRCLILR